MLLMPLRLFSGFLRVHHSVLLHVLYWAFCFLNWVWLCAQETKIEKLRSIHWIVLNEYSSNVTERGYLTDSSFMVPYYDRTKLVKAKKVTCSITELFLLVLASDEMLVRQHLWGSSCRCSKLPIHNQRTLLCDVNIVNFCTARIISWSLEETCYTRSSSNIVRTSKRNRFLW